MFNANGRFFVVEGIDGSGKSTLARALSEQMQQQGLEVVLTREPGATELGKVLRTLVQESKSTLDPYAELLLFAADRAQHMADIVKPALARGALVITDRFKYSSLAYQGYGRELNAQFIAHVNDYITRDVQPDIIFYCAVEPEVALARCSSRGEKQTRFEAEGLPFLKKVAQGFETIFKNNPKVIRIDATQSPDEMLKQAMQAIEKADL
jgi:dTMP kinase